MNNVFLSWESHVTLCGALLSSYFSRELLVGPFYIFVVYTKNIFALELIVTVFQGIYSAKGVPAYISSSLVPRWIVRGDYSAHLTLEDAASDTTNDGGRTLGCFKFMFRLTWTLIMIAIKIVNASGSSSSYK